MRFTHRIRAVKFSLQYRIAARRGVHETVGNNCATVFLLQHSAAKVSRDIAIAAM